LVLINQIPYIDWTTQFLESEDNRLLSFNISSSKNYEFNDNYLNTIVQDIYNKLYSHPDFLRNSGISYLATLRGLCMNIVFSKIARDFPLSYTSPLYIKTNEIGQIPNFIMSGSSYVKQYRATNKTTIPLSSLIDLKLKYNSFICCRGITNHVGPLNLQRLSGEIRVGELLKKKNII
jgi:hypothetical protein